MQKVSKIPEMSTVTVLSVFGPAGMPQLQQLWFLSRLIRPAAAVTLCHVFGQPGRCLTWHQGGDNPSRIVRREAASLYKSSGFFGCCFPFRHTRELRCQFPDQRWLLNPQSLADTRFLRSQSKVMSLWPVIILLSSGLATSTQTPVPLKNTSRSSLTVSSNGKVPGVDSAGMSVPPGQGLFRQFFRADSRTSLLPTKSVSNLVSCLEVNWSCYLLCSDLAYLVLAQRARISWGPLTS